MITPYFLLYLLLWYASRLFTQALRSPLSSILYVFFCLLPLFSLAYLLICRFAVGVFLGSGKGEGQKRTPIDFDMRLVNHSPLPLNVIEADLLVPDQRMVRCRPKRVCLLLLPFGACDLAQRLVFPYRGEYEIGVSDLYLYDFFRLFRVRKRLDTYMHVTILPRRITLAGEGQFSSSDVDSENNRENLGFDRAEIKDVRTYTPGESIKNVHWKLSTKSEDLMIKEYTHPSGNTVYVFADLAAIHSGAYPVDAEIVFGDDVNEYTADGVVETAAALVRRALREGHQCEILWYDSRFDGGIARFAMDSPAQEDEFFHPIATAGIVSEACEVTRLTELIETVNGASYLFVTGRLEQSVAKGVSDFASLVGADSVSLYYVSPKSRISLPEHQKRHRDAVRRCRNALQSRGISVYEPDLSDGAADGLFEEEKTARDKESKKGENDEL